MIRLPLHVESECSDFSMCVFTNSISIVQLLLIRAMKRYRWFSLVVLAPVPSRVRSVSEISLDPSMPSQHYAPPSSFQRILFLAP